MSDLHLYQYLLAIEADKFTGSLPPEVWPYVLPSGPFGLAFHDGLGPVPDLNHLNSCWTLSPEGIAKLAALKQSAATSSPPDTAPGC